MESADLERSIASSRPDYYYILFHRIYPLISLHKIYINLFIGTKLIQGLDVLVSKYLRHLTDDWYIIMAVFAVIIAIKP